MHHLLITKTFYKMKTPITKAIALIMIAIISIANLAFATNGNGVVTVTANNGSCLAYTAAQGNGPDNWEVKEGGSYTMTITGVIECSGDAITVFVQSSSTGNFCFTATGGAGTYSATFTVPNPACNTMPISYKCGADQSCNNDGTYNAKGPSGSKSVHLRASVFNGSCVKTGDDTQCSDVCASFKASESHTPILCHGGSSTVTISATGGTIPYSGTGEFTQSAGTVVYHVTDGYGCTKDVTVTIDEPNKLTASESHTPILCHAGSSTVTISAEGGIEPYSGTGEFSQPAGTVTYTVTDANGCSSEVEVTIGEPEELIASCTPSNGDCHSNYLGSVCVE
jgi:hypothetical protein